jgi:hypothetical protein
MAKKSFKSHLADDRLHKVCTIQAVQAIGSENALLLKNYHRPLTAEFGSSTSGWAVIHLLGEVISKSIRRVLEPVSN